MEFRSGGDLWGMHRVVRPKEALPQAAFLLNSTLPPFDNEILVDVTELQLDSASATQIRSDASGSSDRETEAAYRHRLERIIFERGKMHNPVTNSGGIFLGRIEAIGPHHPLRQKFSKGDEVASLVSLTLTPLLLDSIQEVDVERGRVFLHAKAFIFETGLIAKIPKDLPRGVALAAFDICGAPAQIRRLVTAEDKVFFVGLGKAGRSSALAASLLGAKVFGIDRDEETIRWCRRNIKGRFEVVDASDAVAVFRWIAGETDQGLSDVVIHMTNIENTEMGAILSCRAGGKILFFGMNTSFQRAVLGAEGVGRDVTLLMGSGYVPGHDEFMINLLRRNPPLLDWFEENYG